MKALLRNTQDSSAQEGSYAALQYQCSRVNTHNRGLKNNMIHPAIHPPMLTWQASTSP